jgi:hypothetical protein
VQLDPAGVERGLLSASVVLNELESQFSDATHAHGFLMGQALSAQSTELRERLCALAGAWQRQQQQQRARLERQLAEERVAFKASHGAMEALYRAQQQASVSHAAATVTEQEDVWWAGEQGLALAAGVFVAACVCQWVAHAADWV